MHKLARIFNPTHVAVIGGAGARNRLAATVAHNQPIVAYKAGRYPESAAAASSHTGALAAEDAV